MIDGVKLIPLRKICDERGMILHMLRSNDPHFEQFGETYFAHSLPGAIRGWHLHKEQTQFYAVPIGMIKLVIYDVRENSPTKGELMEIFTGEDNYQLIRIPVGVINGYKTYGTKPALIANCATTPHNPAINEMDRFDPFGDAVPYKWDIVHK